MSIGMRIALTGAAATGALAGAVVGYERWWREPCVTWGARLEEVVREMPGDDLLPEPDLLTTRAISIAAPPSAIWPWLVQMGTGRGLYSADWLESLAGLGSHGVDEVLPELQDLTVGDVQRLGSSGPALRVEVLDPEHALVTRSVDGDWVWSFGLYPQPGDRVTRLVSRNRVVTPEAGTPTRWFNRYVMEPGSLLVERRILLGIRDRAERAVQTADAPEAAR